MNSFAYITPVFYFDQPIWLKAWIVGNEPDKSKLKQVIVDIGGYNTMLSNLGYIRLFMTNSSLQKFCK